MILELLLLFLLEIVHVNQMEELSLFHFVKTFSA